MREQKRPITPTEAKRSLQALDILSGKITEPPPPPQKKQQHESEIQQALFAWANLSSGKYPELRLLHAVPNGGRRDLITAARLKREGVLAGVSDIHLPIPRGKYHSLWLELKAGNNKPTEKQKWWIEEMMKCGNYACVAYSLDEAIKIIEAYLSMSKSS